MGKTMRKNEGMFFFIAALAAVALGGCSRGKAGVSYEFTNVRRGTIERTVSSSGTINPVATVRVLPQMSGKVENIYVDYNDIVRKGDILAELNTDVLRLRYEQQKASVTKARANWELQEMNYRNQSLLAEKNLISEYDLRISRTNLDNQSADLAVAEANLKVIETEINQYAFITSPIDGIVLDRGINIGDTVTDSSSLNSRAMFTIAENLTEMQIEAGVGELDISSIHKGQPVRFSLESLPGRVFPGEVETLRMIPAIANNVVSYTVIVKVENLDGTLMPGMTASVDFIVERVENALVVSNAALRFEPASLSAEKIADMVFNSGLHGLSEEERAAAIAARSAGAAGRAAGGGAGGQQRTQTREPPNTGLTGFVMGPQGTGRGMGPGMGGFGGGGGRQGGGGGGGRQASPVIMRSLWYVADDGRLEVMRVRAGISNGLVTMLHATDELEGRQVILRERL